MRSSGKLYVVEGQDGVGKTTLSKWLVQALRRRTDDRAVRFSFPGQENGSLGKLVYKLHHSPAELQVKKLHPRSLQLLHVAAHIDAIETRITKILQSGTTIVLDRFWWSTWVYGQVAGESAATMDAMIALERVAWGQIQPERVFLVLRRRAISSHRTQRLAELYAQLANAENLRNPVVCVDNNSDLSKARHQILSSLL
jgi:thymidylate kinase